VDFRSLFRRKREKDAPPEDATPTPRPFAKNASAPPGHAPSEIDRLATVGFPGGATLDEAMAIFRHVRTTPDEGRAIDALLARARAHESPSASRVPEPLMVAMASALVDRGEPKAALASIANATSLPALLLRADLNAEQGDLATALALSERVLARELDHPGARDRHRRWREALGFTREAAPRADPSGATLVTQEPESPFRLLREVARGGAGAVYEAEDRELHRKVALKIYHHPERDRSQLVHEARVAAALSGPHVVRVLDADPEHGWLALEWAPLGALRDAIRAKDLARLVPLEAWAVPLASALARVHAAGWVHHDVKPANVLLRAPREPLLSDFGTARRAGDPSPPGSLGYVSPERLAGRASHVKDDVYGFGRILEDVLDALEPLLSAEQASRFRPLVAACVGPDATRPADARAVLTRLRVEAV
jgi:tRNA A-37 threonylcarbamoyl transferase component Bud32